MRVKAYKFDTLSRNPQGHLSDHKFQTSLVTPQGSAVSTHVDALVLVVVDHGSEDAEQERKVLMSIALDQGSDDGLGHGSVMAVSQSPKHRSEACEGGTGTRMVPAVA